MAWIGKVPNVPAHSNFTIDGRVEHTWRKYSSIQDKVTIGEDDLRNPANSVPCNKGQYAIFFRGTVNFMEGGGITLQLCLWGVKLCLTLIYRPIVLITKMLLAFTRGWNTLVTGLKVVLQRTLNIRKAFPAFAEWVMREHCCPWLYYMPRREHAKGVKTAPSCVCTSDTQVCVQ